jgi:ATP-dependent Clp protease ATP-binding subunit ClpX
LIQILKEPKNALLKQYQKLFEMEDVTLTFTEDALVRVAQKAIERKTGARGLRSIMENALLDTMYEIPGQETVREVVVNAEVMDGKAVPLIIHADEEPAPTPKAKGSKS